MALYGWAWIIACLVFGWPAFGLWMLITAVAVWVLDY